jgi:hypothetical protein
VALAFFLATQVSAHGGHDDVPEGEAISGDPIVSFKDDMLIQQRDLLTPTSE